MVTYCSVVIFLLSVANSLSNEVTHMPSDADPIVAADVQTLLKKERESEECQTLINQNVKEVFKNATSKVTLPIRPCTKCIAYGIDTFRVPDNGAKIVSDGKDGILMHVKGNLEELKLLCKDCSMANDKQTTLFGNFDLTWKNGEVELILQRDTADVRDEVKVLFVNATNVNADTVSVRCKGKPEFKTTCKQTHERGELDHVVQASIEHVFIVEEDSALAKSFGSKKQGEKNFSYMFSCSVD